MPESVTRKRLRRTSPKILRRLLREYCHNERLSKERAAFLKRTLLLPPPLLASGLKERLLLLERHLAEPLGSLLEEPNDVGERYRFDKREMLTSYFTLMDSCFMRSYLYNEEEFDNRLNAIWSVYWDEVTKRNEGLTKTL